MFDMPVKFVGYPLGFQIYVDKSMKDELGNPLQLYSRRTYFDINKRMVEVKSTPFNTADYGNGFVLNLNENMLPCARFVELAVVGEYAELAGNCITTEFPGEIVDEGDFNPEDFDPADFYADPQNPGFPQSDNTTYYSERKLIYIETKCFNESLYLRWVNPLGGLDSWLFTSEKESSLTITDPVYMRSLNSRYDNTIQRPGLNRMMVRSGNLSKQRAEALKGLYTSPAAFIQDQQGNRTPVTVITDSFSIHNETESRYACEFEIQLQYENSLRG